MPARSAVKICRVMVGLNAPYGYLQVTATDLYSAGIDHAEFETEDTGEFASIDLSREDLQALDKIVRARKKEDLQIEIRHQDGMSVLDDDGSWKPFLDASDGRKPADLWDQVDELLIRLERVSPVVPGPLLIDPAIMAKFAKVKASGETIADLYMASAEDPILVKIGATFRGAIMPVERQAAEESDLIGPSGLWDFS
jgi:hypothetical protein